MRISTTFPFPPIAPEDPFGLQFPSAVCQDDNDAELMFMIMQMITETEKSEIPDGLVGLVALRWRFSNFRVCGLVDYQVSNSGRKTVVLNRARPTPSISNV